ncbi:MAG: hypothetical protein V1929_00480 [bacterium]
MDVLEAGDAADVLLPLMLRDTCCSAVYRILGRIFRISGNTPEVLDRFALLYRPLEVPDYAGPVDEHIYFRVKSGPDGCVLTVAGCGGALTASHEDFLQWPSVLFNRILLGSVRTHLILHAGAVSRAGQGLVISGNSGMGKSTLVSHLVRRGFGFLSDEVAPIERGTAYVEPFPLCVGLRPGPGQSLLGDASAVDVAFRGDEKKLVDMARLPGAHVSERVPLKAVVLLSSRVQGPVTTARKLDGPVSLVFSDWSPELEAALAAVPGATVVETRPWREFTEVLVQVANLHDIAQPAKDLAVRHGARLVQMLYEDFGERDFDVEPVIAPVAPASALIELVKRMWPYYRAALIRDAYGGVAARLVDELSVLMKGVSFYRLTPGRLDRALDFLEGVMP